MFDTAEEFLVLVDRTDVQSMQRLRSETATEEVWEEVISKHPDVRRAVTLNKTLPATVLRILARDSDPLVRADIAIKMSLPEDIFLLLSEDSEETVRARVASNRKAPRVLIQKLAEDPSRIVSDPAKAQLKL